MQAKLRVEFFFRPSCIPDILRHEASTSVALLMVQKRKGEGKQSQDTFLWALLGKHVESNSMEKGMHGT